MDRELFQTIWPTFSGECREQLEVLAAGLLVLDRGQAERPPGLLGSLRRVAHTLKGSAGSIGLSDVERLVHALEDSLGRDEGQSFTPAAVGALLGVVERIEQLLTRVEQGGSERIPDVEAHLAAIALQLPSSGLPLAAPPVAVSRAGGALHAPGEEVAPDGELWPVFRGEFVDHAQVLRAALDEATARHGLEPDTLEELRVIGASLAGAATALGGSGLQLATRSLERALAVAMPGERRLSQLEQALDGLLRAMQAVDAPEETTSAESLHPGAVTLPPATPLREQFGDEARRVLAALEAGLAGLFTPDAAERSQRCAGLLRLGSALRDSALAVGAFRCAELLGRLGGLLGELAREEPGAPVAGAQLAGLVLELEASVQAFVAESAAASAPGPARSPAPSPTAEQGGAGAPAARASVRVGTDTLDRLIRQVDGLLTFGQRQDHHARALSELVGLLDEALRSHQHVLSELRLRAAAGALETLSGVGERMREVRRRLAIDARGARREAEQLRLGGMAVREDLRELRTTAAASVLEPLRRAVREVASRLGKDVELALEGGEVRVDRRVLEEIKEPLLHLVRNAVDHGLERAADREAAGKPARGTVRISVQQRGTRVQFHIADDGKGLSLERIRATAVQRGLLTEEGARGLSDDETARLVFRAGFTTSAQVTAISGRGVGMEVVHQVVSRLHGHIAIDTRAGLGTRFTLDLPLTLASGMFLVVSGAGAACALPTDGLERTLRLSRSDVGSVGGRAMVVVEGAQLPYATLAELVGGPEARHTPDAGGLRPAVVLAAGDERAVVEVDAVREVQELVIQSLGRRLQQATHLSGAATLEDGSLVAVLNPVELVRRVRASAGTRARKVQRRILVADDALTTRAAMKSVLEIAGYEVTAAPDGEQALRLLNEGRFELVVSDVQMPKLDGLELTRLMRADPRHAATPVLLVTSLEDPADRAAGMEAGASGYLVKREVERGALLELVQQHLPRGGA